MKRGEGDEKLPSNVFDSLQNSWSSNSSEGFFAEG